MLETSRVFDTLKRKTALQKNTDWCFQRLLVPLSGSVGSDCTALAPVVLFDSCSCVWYTMDGKGMRGPLTEAQLDQSAIPSVTLPSKGHTWHCAFVRRDPGGPRGFCLSSKNTVTRQSGQQSSCCESLRCPLPELHRFQRPLLIAWTHISS